MMANPINILLVEDNPADARLIKEVFKDTKTKNRLYVVKDGVEAMAFLNQEFEYTDIPRPDVILLDLNLPRKDGREVLKELKEDDILKRVPIVILTTSSAEEDIIKTYNNHANCYITKPVDFDQFLKVINSIEDFWLSVVKLPSNLNGD
ncbi:MULTISPECIES: response regulator [Methanobacterium]|jgi:CheY-like chemotaxis protein|uniref:Response regulator n=1 Tax=Methanobacterium veterum TaxID=408577 RepID=A0A9E4ZVB9_9EURY|nr:MULTISPECIES: response regulator [Methanobacterium]MCZ3364298.1 response regulator [Methanobacterium veterum]MCZ3372046.1 response regulator [Methanobacterium veterum]